MSDLNRKYVKLMLLGHKPDGTFELLESGSGDVKLFADEARQYAADFHSFSIVQVLLEGELPTKIGWDKPHFEYEDDEADDDEADDEDEDEDVANLLDINQPKDDDDDDDEEEDVDVDDDDEEEDEVESKKIPKTYVNQEDGKTYRIDPKKK
jgi:hypothetical protein